MTSRSNGRVCYKKHMGRHTSEIGICSNYAHANQVFVPLLIFETGAAMMNIAPLGYERYAAVTNLVPKYEIESVTAKSPKRITEPVDAVNTDVARRRGTAARDMTGGNVIARSRVAKAATGRYPESRPNGPIPSNLTLLGEASNGIRNIAESRPVFSSEKVTALYERTNATTVGKAKA